MGGAVEGHGHSRFCFANASVVTVEEDHHDLVPVMVTPASIRHKTIQVKRRCSYHVDEVAVIDTSAVSHSESPRQTPILCAYHSPESSTHGDRRDIDEYTKVLAIDSCEVCRPPPKRDRKAHSCVTGGRDHRKSAVRSEDDWGVDPCDAACGGRDDQNPAQQVTDSPHSDRRGNRTSARGSTSGVIDMRDQMADRATSPRMPIACAKRWLCEEDVATRDVAAFASGGPTPVSDAVA